MREINEMKSDPRARPEDLPSLESSISSSEVIRDQYMSTYRTQIDVLESNDDLRTDIVALIKSEEKEYRDRLKGYLERSPANLSIDDVLSPLSGWVTALVRRASNYYGSGNAEAALMGATGQVYRIVGMEMVRSDDPEMADAREVTTE